MKKVVSSFYAIASYAVGFVSLVYWIASTGNLLPETSIDGEPRMNTILALLKDVALVLLFALQHSVMARKGFKNWLTRYIPVHLERSTYVLMTGLVVVLMVWQWEPLGGVIWDVRASAVAYYFLYSTFFFGWVILFISTFLVNHFDLFGLRQAYLNFKNEPYSEIDFKVISLYKYTRHPIYLGAIIGVWSTPLMTVTHMVFALLLTAYIFVGIQFEERDLIRTFGEDYLRYKASTPMLLPFKKNKTKKDIHL